MTGLPAAVPRYARVVDRYECPMCGATLYRYRTNTEYEPWPSTEIERVVRTFEPCGCVAVWPEPNGDEVSP